MQGKKPLICMYITNDPAVALMAEKHGVDRIFVDLETLGKEERQGHLDSVKSHHSVDDVRSLRQVLTRSELLVRINPMHDGSKEEIEAVLAAGADIVMLPMWRTPEEVQKFTGLVAGRCRTMLLLETDDAERCLDQVLELTGIDEVHIGLNDLHLCYHKTFMFQLLSDGTVERICKKLRNAGKVYGFGGVGRPGEGILPAERILGEHMRLGSHMVILSRTFCDMSRQTDLAQADLRFRDGMADLRRWESVWREADGVVLEENRQEVVRCVAEIVDRIGRKV